MTRSLSTASETPTNSTRAVDRALALLSQVCAEPSLSLTECAHRTQLPPSTALRLLRTLENSGFVTRATDGGFGAGPRMVQIGTRALSTHRIVALGRPALARVVDQTRESAYLALPGPGRTAIYAAVHEGTHPIRHSSWVGRDVGEDARAVRCALQGAVAPGTFMGSRGTLEPDITAIAAPVHSEGRVVAAIVILGPTYRIDETALSDFGAVLCSGAHQIELQLGKTPPTTRVHSAAPVSL